MRRAESRRAVALIPARGGSKGIPGKNLELVGGIPLVARTIRAASECERIAEIYVSSDEPAILELASQRGASVIRRPPDIAGDTSSSEAAILHAIPLMKDPDIVVFLQCTSPFTTPADIAKLVGALDEGRFNSALTVVDDHPFLWGLDSKGEAIGINHDPSRERVMRQNLPPQFRETGQGYAFRTEAFLKTRNRFCLPIALVRTDHPPFEIDEPRDLALAEAFARVIENGRSRE